MSTKNLIVKGNMPKKTIKIPDKPDKIEDAETAFGDDNGKTERILHDDDSEGVNEVIEVTLSLNLEEGDQDKTVDEDSEVECQISRSTQSMSPLHLEPLLTRKGTYVLTNATLKGRNTIEVNSEEEQQPAASAQSSNVEEVYFERLDMHLGPDSAAELLNEYYDELNDTVTNMKDLQKNYDKLNNLNKCNMNMMRREMTDWADYYKLQVEQTNLLAATREAELKEAKARLKNTLVENKQLKETNSKLEMAINNERMKLKRYIQQNIKDRVKQMTNSIILPEVTTSHAKKKPNPNENFLKNKDMKDNEPTDTTHKIGRKVEKNKSPVEIRQLKPEIRTTDLRPLDKEPATVAKLPPSKKPKVFLAHAQAWDISTSVTHEKHDNQHLVKKSKAEVTKHQSVPVIKVAEPKNPEEKRICSPEANHTSQKCEALNVVKDAKVASTSNGKTLKLLKAKEYEDILPSVPSTKKVTTDDAQSLDESLSNNPRKGTLDKKQLPVRHKPAKVIVRR